MSVNRTKCPKKADRTDLISPLHARHAIINPIAQRTDISIASACFPPSRIDRCEKKRPATLVERRGEKQAEGVISYIPVFRETLIYVLHARNYPSSKKGKHMNRTTQWGGQRHCSSLRSSLRVSTTLAAVAAIALIAGGKPSEAIAADGTTDVTVQVAEGDENLAWSVPTQIPMKATADGTLIGPDADAIAIRNLSAFPIRIKQMNTTAEAPFNLVDDVDKSSGSNDFQMSMNDTAIKQIVELTDDGTWSMGYAGNDKGSDVLPITISNAKIARVTANLSAAKKAATVTWTVEPTAKEVKQPGATEPGGSDSVQAAVAKDAKDWTLDEQEAVAKDIAQNGTSSIAYAKAKAAMDAGTKFSIKLTDDKTLEYRIVGINHDDLADGSGKAGLTFEATNTALGDQKMNATNASTGGWEKSELRGRLNTGDLWSLLPSGLQSKVKSVTKMTDNQGGDDETGTPSATTDKVFLLSSTEVWGNLNSDGTQYEYYKSKGVTMSNYSGASSSSGHWTRSVIPGDSTNFRIVFANGRWNFGSVASTNYVFPAFSF